MLSKLMQAVGATQGARWSRKVWKFGGPFFRPGKSWKTAKVMESHGK